MKFEATVLPSREIVEPIEYLIFYLFDKFI